MKIPHITAVTILMSLVSSAASSAEYGLGAFITSRNEVMVPIEFSGGDWLVQPSVVHYSNKEPTGDTEYTGLFVNTLKKIKQYEKVSLHAGMSVGMGEGKDINRVFDISANTVKTYQRKYAQLLVMPNLQATYAVTENFGIGGQFGFGYWSSDYSYDAYSPNPTDIPKQTSTALKSMLFVRYMFR